MIIRGKGAFHAYKTCRSFGLGIAHSFIRALRYAVTGRTGRYKIDWTRGLKYDNKKAKN